MSDLMPATTTISGNEYSATAGATANGEGSSSHHQQQQTTKTSTSTIIGGGGGTATSPNFSNPANMQTTASSAGLNLAFTNPKGAKLLADFKQIILELRAQNFDVIRFATYRTASKLRFIQKKLNLHLIDLWNVIETFRDNNFHTLDVLSELEMSKVEQCIQNMYIQLNKRLALNQQINVETQTQLLLAWLFCLYDKSRLARIKLFSLKVVLTTLCSGKLVDKLKYTFNQISEHNKNLLSMHKFDLYLRELLVLPKAVFEEPSFGYNDAMARSCFDANTPVRIEDFLSVALSDVGPPCFIWLNIFHRFINVQSVVHPVTCSACERTNFIGFRYKCQKCRKYQLCQDCFWRGRISHSHQLTHQMKEYTSYKSTAKQISNSLKRSFFCKPNKQVPPSSSSSMNNGPHTHHYHHQTPTSTTAAATKPGSIRTMPNYQQQTSRQTPTTSGNSKPMSSTTPTSAPYQMPPTSGSPLPPHQTQSSHHHHHHHRHQTGQQQQQPAITLLGGLQQPIPSVGANNSSSATAASNSALNNSDYNLIYGYQQSSHHHHQQQPPPKLHTHQTLSNITNNATTNGGIPVTSSLPLNPSELLYSKLPKSPKTKKLLVHTNGATSNGGTPILDDNEDDESSPTIHELSSAQLHQQQQQQQKSIDLTHLLPSVALNAHNELQQQQILRQQAAASSNTGNYSNTLSMTRTKNTDNINSTLNLFASFLLSNPNLNSTSSNGGVGINNGETVSTNNVAQTQQEEHNIIANYCSRLAQYYAQNPHLAQSSPTNTTSPTPQQQQQHQMQPPPAQPQMGLQSRTSSLSRQQQHHYQQSNRSKYSTLRPCQVPITTATAIGPTNRSLSESNFACNGDDEDETGVVNEYSLDDRLLKEKREIVAKLERQNREIAKEIKRLRMRQSSNQYLDLYSTDSSDYMSPSSAAAAAANSSSSSSAAAATIRYQQLLQQYQQQQQRSAAATAAAVNAYSNIYSTTKSRETTPATVKKPIDPNLIAELRNLKVKKGELDTRMQILINSRDQLMDRLAQLDLLIKTPSNTTTTATNNSQQQQQQPQTNKQQQIPATTTTTATTTTSSNGQPSGSHSRSWSTPSTPAAAHYEFHHPNRHVYNQYQQQPTANATTSTTNAYQQQQRLYGHYGNAISQQTSMLSLTGGSLANSSAGGLNDSIDSGGSSLRILRNDLLIAADSVTNAMQTLVNELNSEDVINDNFDRVTSKLENSENGHHYHHVNPTNLNGDSSNVINDGEEEAIYRLQQQQQQIYRNNIPTSSVSASATPVTYRKYHFHHQQQQQQQQQQPTVNNNTTTSNTSNTHRNAINLDDFGVDYLSTNGGGGGENNSAEIHEISAQILNGFNSNVNNNNENNEDDIRAAYMESFIDELSKKEIISGLQMSCNPTEIDLDEVEQNLMMCNLGENSEQIAEWRRELEQVLTDQQQQQQQQNDSAAAQNNTKSSTIESNNNANTNNSN